MALHELTLSTSSPTPTNVLSIGTGGLTISDEPTQTCSSLQTCASTTGTGFVGKAFTGGLYIEVTMQFDPALADPAKIGTDGSWPIFWLTGQISEWFGTKYNINFVELDGFEGPPH